MATQEGTAKSAGFIVVSDTPDICKSPGAPIPYNIVGFLHQSILTSTNVNFQGFPVFDMMSRVATVVGDEAGVGGGVVSQTFKGMCRPIVPATTVKCNGNLLCRHLHTKFEMNCLGPDGPSNTIGTVIYLGAMMCGPVGPNGAMPGGANEVVGAEAAGEASALDKIKNSLSIDSIEDAVSLSQKAYDMSQVDWSDPSAALGALAGAAGRAGFGDLSQGMNLAKKAMNTDWDDPVAALTTAAALAGPALAAANAVDDYLGGERVSHTPQAQALNQRDNLSDEERAIADLLYGPVQEDNMSHVGNLSLKDAIAVNTLAYDGQPGDYTSDGKYRIKDNGLFEDDSGMRAIVLEPRDPNDSRTLVAFAGVDPSGPVDFVRDGRNAVSQAVGGVPAQYQNGNELIGALNDQFGENLVVTGHSMGSGIGSYGAEMHGTTGVGLNSAPLGSGTRADIANNGQGALGYQHYNNQFDLISSTPGQHLGTEWKVEAPDKGLPGPGIFSDHAVAEMDPNANISFVPNN